MAEEPLATEFPDFYRGEVAEVRESFDKEIAALQKRTRLSEATIVTMLADNAMKQADTVAYKRTKQTICVVAKCPICYDDNRTSTLRRTPGRSYRQP